MNAFNERRSADPGFLVGCHALIEARLSAMGSLRDRPAAAGCPPLPPRFLRHADEQTVVGMHAVLAALATLDALPAVQPHGVVAAPCQAGRIAGAKTLAAYAAGGGVAVSPHVVPQCSLHSVAGAVSVALGMHGPQLGVGGGPEALGEGLLVAASLLAGGGDPACTGVWLVATEWDEEPRLDPAGAPLDDPICRGLALLIEPAGTADDGDRLPSPIAFDVRMTHGDRAAPLHSAAGGLLALARALDMCRDGRALAAWAVSGPGGSELRISRRAESAARPNRRANPRRAALPRREAA